MNTLRLIFAILLYVPAFSGPSQQELLLEGRIGNLPIIMELSLQDSSCQARYFYLGQRKDIFLEGSIDKRGLISLSTRTYGSDELPEEIVLQKKGAGYEGSWKKGKRFRLSLRPSSTTKLKSPYDHLPEVSQMKQKEPYQYLVVSGLRFNKDSVSIAGGLTLEWYTERYSGIRMPRILSGYSSAAVESINRELLSAHLSESQRALGCYSPWGAGYDFHINHLYAGAGVFSIDLSASYYCGGAHPDFLATGLNFDARTGKRLKLEDIYRFDKNSNPLPEDSDTWFDYRDNHFAPALVRLLTRLYPQEMKPADEESCKYNDGEAWNFPNWYFTEKGVYFGAVFSSYMRACDYPEWSVIPYKELKPYLVMKSPPAELLK